LGQISVILAILAFDLANGGKLQFTATRRQFSGKNPNQLNISPTNENAHRSLKMHSLQRGSEKFTINQNGYGWIVNISLGARAQSFVTCIDLFWESDLSVISSNADLSSVAEYLPDKHLYDPKDSLSFTRANKTFSRYRTGSGHLASDFIEVKGNDLNKRLKQDDNAVNLTFALIDDIGYVFQYEEIDAYLGLAPLTSENNSTNVLTQILKYLNRPVATVWSNYTQRNDEGQLKITLGDTDIENCMSNWMYTPVISTNYYFGAHVKRAEVTVRGIRYVATVNGTLTFYPYYSNMFVPQNVLYLFTNASRAQHIYNETSSYYTVDCNNIHKFADVTLHIGSGRYSTELVLTPYDYVYRVDFGNVSRCFLAVYGYKNDTNRDIEIGAQFLNNHCMAHDVRNKLIGFADARASRKGLRMKMMGGVASTASTNRFEITLPCALLFFHFGNYPMKN